MTIVLAADHRGFQLKEELKTWLDSQNYEIKDFGADTLVKDDDYPDYAISAANFIVADIVNRHGIFICGSGQGMAIAANKIKGVRALVIDKPGEFSNDVNPNVLSLSADSLTVEQAKAIIGYWFKVQDQSLDERHARRIGKLEK